MMSMLGEVSRGGRDYGHWIQRSLNQVLGLHLVEDGVIGSQTRSAIRSFQLRQGLAVDGRVGPLTERALIAAGASRPDGARTPFLGLGPSPFSQLPPDQFVVAGVALPPPVGLSVTNFVDPRVFRFRGRNRRGRVISEFVVHETVTRSVADTVAVLRQRNLGVHLILGPDGAITQHGDLADDSLGHAGPTHNSGSVGVEVVNPYYPENLRPGLLWTRTIRAGWAHKGRYVVPTPPQAEAVAQLTAWISSPAARGLAIPRTWIGAGGGQMTMGRVAGGDQRRPGIYAHTYFGHADGSWLVLYAWLRIEKNLPPVQAYEEAIRLATTRANTVPLP